MNQANSTRMDLIAALRVLVAHRGERIVVTTMGSAREWPKLSRHPLDFHYVPSAMGEAPALALGLALAKPKREVLVVNGDGGMLMNLGSLVTIAASGARNLTLVVLDNGIYEVTGGQRTAAAALAGGSVDYVSMAIAAGLSSALRFDRLDDWQQGAGAALAAPGPKLIALAVHPVGAAYHLEPPGPLGPRVEQFTAALAAINDR